MKKFFVLMMSILLITGCNDKKDDAKKEEKESNDNKIVEESNINSNDSSNEISNEQIDSTSNVTEKSNTTSNKVSNVTSNKVSNVTSNKESNVTSNKESNVTSNKPSNTTSNKPSNTTSNSVSNTTSNSTSNTTSSNKVGTTSKGYKIEKKNGIYYINGILIANKTYDLPSTYNPGGLLPEFNTAFNKMKSAAANDGITLTIVSGFRSYSYQNTLYNNYVARDGKAAADRYSARPGHSEHQTGLGADFNQVSDSFGETKAGKWLANNCWRYGFILRYPKGKESLTGYMYESWHFRYLGDVELAKTLYNNGNWITLEEYLGIDSKYE